jgi:large subunit ribosomal protein L24
LLETIKVEGKLRVDREKNKAIVEGVNMVSKHTKPSAKSPQGGIVKKKLLFKYLTYLIDPKQRNN